MGSSICVHMSSHATFPQQRCEGLPRISAARYCHAPPPHVRATRKTQRRSGAGVIQLLAHITTLCVEYPTKGVRTCVVETAPQRAHSGLLVDPESAPHGGAQPARLGSPKETRRQQQTEEGCEWMFLPRHSVHGKGYRRRTCRPPSQYGGQLHARPAVYCSHICGVAVYMRSLTRRRASTVVNSVAAVKREPAELLQLTLRELLLGFGHGPVQSDGPACARCATQSIPRALRSTCRSHSEAVAGRSRHAAGAHVVQLIRRCTSDS